MEVVGDISYCHFIYKIRLLEGRWVTRIDCGRSVNWMPSNFSVPEVLIGVGFVKIASRSSHRCG